MAVKHDTFPTLLILRGVICTDTRRHGEGAFAEVFRGIYNGVEVALKFPRMYSMMSAEEKEALRKVSPSVFFSNLPADLLMGNRHSTGNRFYGKV